MKRILCFGDSNTWGHNPIDCSQLDCRWTVLLRKRMPECEIIEDGTCGRATIYGEIDEEGHNGIVSFRERYLQEENQFDLVVIMLGTNDLLNENHASPKEVGEALRLYVREYRARFGGQARMLLVSPIWIRQEMCNHPIFSERYSEQSITSSHELAAVIARVAEEECTDFLDAAKYAQASAIDGVHMGPSDHEKLAWAIEKKIREILQM